MGLKNRSDLTAEMKSLIEKHMDKAGRLNKKTFTGACVDIIFAERTRVRTELLHSDRSDGTWHPSHEWPRPPTHD